MAVEHQPTPIDLLAEKQRRERRGADGRERAVLSEDAAALRFEEQFSGRLLFDHDAGRWLEWDGQRWRPDRTDRALHYARELARELACDQSS